MPVGVARLTVAPPVGYVPVQALPQDITVTAGMTTTLIFSAWPLAAMVRDSAVTIAWSSPAVVTGAVRLWATDVPTRVVPDVRGEGIQGETHIVIADGLRADVTYQFDVLSGGGVDDAQGLHYATHTGPPLLPSLPQTIVGRIRRGDGGPAHGALVYLYLRRGVQVSTPVITMVQDDGWWQADISDMRHTDLGSFFSPQPGDTLLLVAVLPGSGSAQAVYVLSGAFPVVLADLSLQP